MESSNTCRMPCLGALGWTPLITEPEGAEHADPTSPPYCKHCCHVPLDTILKTLSWRTLWELKKVSLTAFRHIPSGIQQALLPLTGYIILLKNCFWKHKFKKINQRAQDFLYNLRILFSAPPFIVKQTPELSGSSTPPAQLLKNEHNSPRRERISNKQN